MPTQLHHLTFLVILTLVAGCSGPLTFPMVERLQPEDQAEVEEIWNNVLTPIGRLDRDTLLDTVVASQLHQQGIDRLNLQCEKVFDGGRIVFRLSFDRARPAGDVLEIDIFDNAGRRVRSEEYAGAEVLERTTMGRHGCSDENWYGELSEWSRQLTWEMRALRVSAATRPAGQQ